MECTALFLRSITKRSVLEDAPENQAVAGTKTIILSQPFKPELVDYWKWQKVLKNLLGLVINF